MNPTDSTQRVEPWYLELDELHDQHAFKQHIAACNFIQSIDVLRTIKSLIVHLHQVALTNLTAHLRIAELEKSIPIIESAIVYKFWEEVNRALTSTRDEEGALLSLILPLDTRTISLILAHSQPLSHHINHRAQTLLKGCMKIFFGRTLISNYEQVTIH